MTMTERHWIAGWRSALKTSLGFLYLRNELPVDSPTHNS